MFVAQSFFAVCCILSFNAPMDPRAAGAITVEQDLLNNSFSMVAAVSQHSSAKHGRPVAATKAASTTMWPWRGETSAAGVAPARRCFFGIAFTAAAWRLAGSRPTVPCNRVAKAFVAAVHFSFCRQYAAEAASKPISAHVLALNSGRPCSSGCPALAAAAPGPVAPVPGTKTWQVVLLLLAAVVLTAMLLQDLEAFGTAGSGAEAAALPAPEAA